MDEVLVVGVGELLGLRVVDFGQNERGEGGGLRGGRGGVFGEDGGAVCDAGAGRVGVSRGLEIFFVGLSGLTRVGELGVKMRMPWRRDG